MKRILLLMFLSVMLSAYAGDDKSVYDIPLEEHCEDGENTHGCHNRGKRSRQRYRICEICRNKITVSGFTKEQVISYQLLDMTGACVFEAGMDDVFLDYLYSIGDGTYQIAIITDSSTLMGTISL